MNTQIGQTTLGEILPNLISIVFLLLLIVFCIKMTIGTSKAKKQAKNKIKDLQQQGLTIFTTLPHVNGLPVPENIMCEIYSYPNRYEIKVNSMQFSLSKDKVMDVCVKSETEIQEQYVSSIGGAVGGAVLFGPLGAMIGGRAKKKKSKTTTHYLIITYKKDDEIKYIGFNASFALAMTFKLVEEFKNNKTITNDKIEL